MPPGSKNGGASTDANGGERPVVFQQYFKNGNRTYASQVKVSQTGRKYLVLTEGHRDSKTQELKKHTIYVFDQDLKQFFALLQETVLYLRSAKEPAGPAAGLAAKAVDLAAPGNGRPAKPPITARPPSPPSGNGGRIAATPQKAAIPAKAAATSKSTVRSGTARTSAPRSTTRANSR